MDCDLCAVNSSLEDDGGRVGCGYALFRSQGHVICLEQPVLHLGAQV
jgi:hypothetical protein